MHRFFSSVPKKRARWSDWRIEDDSSHRIENDYIMYIVTSIIVRRDTESLGDLLLLRQFY